MLPCPRATLHPRADANLQEPRSRVPMPVSSQGVVIHHTAGTRSNGPPHSASIVHGIQAYHMGARKGWSDIGYHWLFDDWGHVWEGRGWGVAGAHSSSRPGGGRSMNSRSHGLAYIGRGDRRAHKPTEDAIAAALWLIEEHDRRYGAGFVVGHRDVAATICPGKSLYERLVVPLARPLEGGA